MPSKDIEKRRAAIRKHYYNNRKYYIDKAIRQKQELRKWVYSVKNSTPCMDCGIQYPHYVTDFDHISNDKTMTVSRMINRGGAKQVKEEIKKCELVCSNCHRERTYNRRNDKNKI